MANIECPEIKGRVYLNEPLSKHTTFRIGGPADYLIEPADLSELKKVLLFCRKKRVPYLVIGAGSNLLIKDKGIRGAVIRLNAPYFKKARVSGRFLTIGAGARLALLASMAKRAGLGGLEFLAGIPGTVGGALLMNAGIRCSEQGERKEIGGLIKEVRVMSRSGEVMRLKRDRLKFGYRSSNLGKYIVLEARFHLNRKPSEEIQREMKGYLVHKKKTQELSVPSAGCIFKNPDRAEYPAGYLIDVCGFKGKRVGDAQVSKKHANFIVNFKNAKASDVLALIKLIQRKVREQFRINLQLEIRVA
jgi:UDP-N-acetylmuramate dehydrogenase